MDRPFLIEIRMRGDISDLCKKLIFDIYRKFRVSGMVRTRPVPHITLFGPFSCRYIKDVIQAIKVTGKDHTKLEYQVKGFDYFELKKKFLFITTSSRKNVIYLKVNPSDELVEFRSKLAQKLLKITDSANIDSDSEFHFHATLAMKDIDRKFEDIWEYLKRYDIAKYGTSYRVTLLKKGKIICEYDFHEGKVLRRSQVLGRFRRK